MRVREYLGFNKLRILFKIFFESQLNTVHYHGRNTGNKIKKLQERALRLVYTTLTPSINEIDLGRDIKISLILEEK